MSSDAPDPETRFPRDGWFFASTTGAVARFIGGIAGLLLVLPFVADTFLERGVGELPALVILVAAAGAGLAGAIVFFARRYLVLGLFATAATVGFGVAAYITAVMDW